MPILCCANGQIWKLLLKQCGLLSSFPIVFWICRALLLAQYFMHPQKSLWRYTHAQAVPELELCLKPGFRDPPAVNRCLREAMLETNRALFRCWRGCVPSKEATRAHCGNTRPVIVAAFLSVPLFPKRGISEGLGTAGPVWSAPICVRLLHPSVCCVLA